jgi:hypothetical protein
MLDPGLSILDTRNRFPVKNEHQASSIEYPKSSILTSMALYSSSRASIGFILAALRAGINPASDPAMTSSMIAPIAA